MHLEYCLRHYHTSNNLLANLSPPNKVIFKKSLQPLNYFQYLLDKQESFKNKSYRHTNKMIHKIIYNKKIKGNINKNLICQLHLEMKEMELMINNNINN
jgi:hypothetical protein